MKGTTLRGALKEAAADSFNDVETPGQRLLVGLQTAEVRLSCRALTA